MPPKCIDKCNTCRLSYKHDGGCIAGNGDDDYTPITEMSSITALLTEELTIADAEFIESLPEQYGTIVGERGIRLSGGQRQRIGIARALYKRASVLVFDEATSALDNETEAAVMDAIERLDRDLTILIIAHRLSTVAGCDHVIKLAEGEVAAQGTYDEVVGAVPINRPRNRSGKVISL